MARRGTVTAVGFFAAALAGLGLLTPQLQAPAHAGSGPTWNPVLVAAHASDAPPSARSSTTPPAPTLGTGTPFAAGEASPTGSVSASGGAASDGPSGTGSSGTGTSGTPSSGTSAGPTADTTTPPTTATPTTTEPTTTEPTTPAPATTAPAATTATGPDCAVLACLALTFDDGPGPYTAQLLDELAARQVPATFFVVGYNIARHPDLIAREAAAGDAIGNHTASHQNLTTLSPADAAAQIDQVDAQLAALGVTPVLARPPYGATNDQVDALLASRGLGVAMWSVDTLDWQNRDAAKTTANALAGAHPGGIVLMHDIHPTTVAAVPGIVDALRAAGYTLVTVPQLLGTVVPGQVYHHR